MTAVIKTDTFTRRNGGRAQRVKTVDMPPRQVRSSLSEERLKFSDEEPPSSSNTCLKLSGIHMD